MTFSCSSQRRKTSELAVLRDPLLAVPLIPADLFAGEAEGIGDGILGDLVPPAGGLNAMAELGPGTVNSRLGVLLSPLKALSRFYDDGHGVRHLPMLAQPCCWPLCHIATMPTPHVT